MAEPSADEQYCRLLSDLLGRGEDVVTRNSPVKRLVHRTAAFDRAPLVSARKTAWRNALREWEWFMSGSDNIHDLHESVRPWWRPWADAGGDVRYIYGQQFRHFVGRHGATDQIAKLLDGVSRHPHSRRNCMTTWNADEMWADDCPITCCHTSFLQATVDTQGRLSIVTVQRSSDVVVGLGANWIQSWAFLLWLAHHSGRGVGTLTWVGLDVHVYQQHFDLARRIADALPNCRTTPDLVYDPPAGVEDFRADDFRLGGEYAPVIAERAEMVV